MKIFVLILFTFSGICSGLAQNQSGTAIPDSQQHAVKPQARLFPNPARYRLEIGLTGFEGGFLQLQFFDSHGTRVRNEKRLLFNGNEILTVMFALEPGIYLLILKQKDKILRKKMVVE